MKYKVLALGLIGVCSLFSNSSEADLFNRKPIVGTMEQRSKLYRMQEEFDKAGLKVTDSLYSMWSDGIFTKMEQRDVLPLFKEYMRLKKQANDYSVSFGGEKLLKDNEFLGIQKLIEANLYGLSLRGGERLELTIDGDMGEDIKVEDVKSPKDLVFYASSPFLGIGLLAAYVHLKHKIKRRFYK